MRSKTGWIVTASAVVALAMTATAAWAEGSAWNTNDKGVVLDGYDVVAYFNADQAVRGTAKYGVENEGASFYFSSAENRDAFRSDPEKYAPKFGGYCAFAVGAKGAKAPVDPETFKIYNGELLLFFNDLYEGKKVNAKVMWNGDEENLFAQAEKNWAKP